MDCLPASQSRIFAFSAEVSKIVRYTGVFPGLRVREKLRFARQQRIFARFFSDKYRAGAPSQRPPPKGLRHDIAGRCTSCDIMARWLGGTNATRALYDGGMLGTLWNVRRSREN
jgi:hypothetical protein